MGFGLGLGIRGKIERMLLERGSGFAVDRWLKKHPEELPLPYTNVSVEIQRRVRNLTDPDGSNRSLPIRWIQLFHELQNAQSDFPFDFREKSVLNFGAGTKNPLGLGLVFIVQGAKQCFCLEPGELDEDNTLFCLYEQVMDCLARPEAYGLARATMMERVERALDLTALLKFNSLKAVLAPGGLSLIASDDGDLSERLAPQSIDFIYSRSVLEHLEEPALTLERLTRFLSSQGRMVHSVDFTSHDATEKFRLYHTEMTQVRTYAKYEGLNGWRVSDYRAFFEKLGYQFASRDLALIDEKEIDFARLSKRFQKYSKEELCIAAANLIVY